MKGEMLGLPLAVLVVRIMTAGLLLSTILTLKFVMIFLRIMTMIMMRMTAAPSQGQEMVIFFNTPPNQDLGIFSKKLFRTYLLHILGQ